MWGKKRGNYMRKCASGGQSLANAERGVGMSGFAGKIGDLYTPHIQSEAYAEPLRQEFLLIKEIPLPDS